MLFAPVAIALKHVIISLAFPFHSLKTSRPSSILLSSNEDDHDAKSYELRFGGVGRLYANEKLSSTDALQRVSEATVAVIGIGGVGSWVAESLCRSGVGNIILIDLDDICISNSNRQLHATSSYVGKMKVDVMRDRLLDINPTVNVTTIMDFINEENAEDVVRMMLPELTCLVDAIDGKREKAALIAAAARQKVSIVTCGGAAGRVDPSQVLCDDIIKVQEDRLLFWVRKDLRQRYGFPKGPEKFDKKTYKPRKWNIWSVYSTEIQKNVAKGDRSLSSSLRTCDSSLGTASFVTGTYGLVAAAKVVSMIMEDKLIRPRFRGSPVKVKQKSDNDILNGRESEEIAVI